MSTTTHTPTTEASKPPRHIDILPGAASQLYAHLHPVLLLSLLSFSFTSLVDDPVNTLLGLTGPLVLVQAIYCVVCLPSQGQTPPPALKPGQKKKAGKSGQEMLGKLAPAFYSFVLTAALSAPLLCVIVILFGAPLVSHHAHTFLLAVHLALLTAPQLFYVHGLEAATWLRLASLQQPVDELYGMTLGACVGAWLGAIPIPLDWDREWQKWPVTIVCGVYGGAVLGKLAGGYLFRGLKMKMN